jgi:hypothetical protein
MKHQNDFKVYRIGMKLDSFWDSIISTEAFKNLMLSNELLDVLGSPYISMIHLALLTNAKTTEYNKHISNFLASREFRDLVKSQAFRMFVSDCEISKTIKTFKVFKVKQAPKKTDESDDTTSSIKSLSKLKKILFSFIVYNTFRDTTLSNKILSSDSYKALYESEEAEQVARTQIAHSIAHSVYNGETEDLSVMVLDLLSSHEFSQLADSQEMEDFLNSSNVVDFIKSYLVTKKTTISAQDASKDSTTESTEKDQTKTETTTESTESTEACDLTNNLYLDSTSVPSESTKTESTKESTEETSEESKSSTTLLGSWVSKTINCKSATESSESDVSDSSETKERSVTPQIKVSKKKCCKENLINQHNHFVKKGGYTTMKERKSVSLSGLIRALEAQYDNPQINQILRRSDVQNMISNLKKITPNQHLAKAVKNDSQASQCLAVVSKALQTNNVQEINTAMNNNAQRLNTIVSNVQRTNGTAPTQQTNGTTPVQKPTNGMNGTTPVQKPTNGMNGTTPVQKPTNGMNGTSPLIGGVPTPKPNTAYIQSLFKNSFTYVVYRYFKHNADIKTYSKFVNTTVTKQQFDKWKCSDDSVAEFQLFVTWYCNNLSKVVKAIRRSIVKMMDDEVDFITDDLYASFKKFIQFADWVNFNRFIAQSSHHKHHHAQDEVYRRSDFEDWKDMFSESDFESTIDFMLSQASDDLFAESCQKCCQ